MYFKFFELHSWGKDPLITADNFISGYWGSLLRTRRIPDTPSSARLLLTENLSPLAVRNAL